MYICMRDRHMFRLFYVYYILTNVYRTSIQTPKRVSVSVRVKCRDRTRRVRDRSTKRRVMDIQVFVLFFSKFYKSQIIITIYFLIEKKDKQYKLKHNKCIPVKIYFEQFLSILSHSRQQFFVRYTNIILIFINSNYGSWEYAVYIFVDLNLY